MTPWPDGPISWGLRFERSPNFSKRVQPVLMARKAILPKVSEPVYDWLATPRITLSALAKRLPDGSEWLARRRAELGLSDA